MRRLGGGAQPTLALQAFDGSEYGLLVLSAGYDARFLRRFGGGMPDGMKQEDGWLWRMTKSTDWERVGVQEESDYFAALGLPTLPPPERTEARLKELLRVKA